MATVETRRLRKQFDGVAAVDGIDLAVQEGEFLVLLGPSGCGKTTLLRMIAGLEMPSAGDVLIGGEVVTGLPPRARNIAMVFQSYALYPHLSVAENIAFPLHARGIRGAAAQQRVERAAAMFGIAPLLKRKPRQLSGGERQRVALARAVVREPVVFLLDEPLSNLDAQLRSAARDELQQFQRRLGTTTVYVTHDQIEALGLGDRIAVLDHGRLHQLGTPAEIYAEPADTFVATFIGSPPMNLVDDGQTITGFRPEQLLLRAAAADGAVTPFPVDVSRLEYLGADRLVYGTLAPPWPASRVIARLPAAAEQTMGAGERREFYVRSADLRRFDPRSGLRLQ